MTFYAIYDGEALRPDGPLDLKEGARVRVTLDEDVEEGAPYSSLILLREMKLDGPPDWSERINEYLTGEQTWSEDEG